MGVRAADEDGVETIRHLEIVDVGALASQQPRILDALPARSDVGLHQATSRDATSELTRDQSLPCSTVAPLDLQELLEADDAEQILLDRAPIGGHGGARAEAVGQIGRKLSSRRRRQP